MLNHIVFDSSLDFVIIGSKGTKDGILIRSKSVDIKLIGLAHRLYRKKMVDRTYLFRNLVKFVWSSSFLFGHRESSLLIVFQNSKLVNNNAPGNSTKRNRFTASDEDAIQKEFNRFIENSFLDLSELVSPTDFTNSPHPRVNTGHLLWNIAPLILTCSNEVED